MTNREKLKLELAEAMGIISASQIKVNGESGQVILDAESLIKLLKKVQEAL